MKGCVQIILVQVHALEGQPQALVAGQHMNPLLRPDVCRVPVTEDGKDSSWADLLAPQQSGASQHDARSLQASLPQEVVLQYDQGQKQCFLSPLDSHNVKLLDNVHPSQWTNPDTADK